MSKEGTRMDVEREVAAANRRIQAGIERNYIIAMARLEGITPVEYAEQLDRAHRAAELSAQQNAMQAVGEAYGALARSLRDMADNFAQGFARAFGR